VPTLATLLALVVAGCARHRPDTSASSQTVKAAPVRPGVESFVANPPPFAAGKRLGLITNHTGVDSAGRSGVDLLHASGAVELVALFGPEHGIRGTAAPGVKISSGTDERTGLPVYSLYGPTRKPTAEMLKDVDVLAFDIQDVGARPYTYVYTMALGMQAARDKGIPFVVLDRPNPIGGEAVEGNLLDPKFATFVGMYPIPMRHGMTAGELAKLFNDRFGIGCNLTVVPVANWRRGAWFDATALPWVPPSPNLPRLEAAIHYPGTVLFEGTNLSCGRGTSHPFEQVGAPWLDTGKVIELMNGAALPGVRFEPVTFTPTAPGDDKFAGTSVAGVRLTVTDRRIYRPVATSIRLIATVRGLHPEQFEWRVSHFDRLAGTDRLRASIEGGTLDAFLKGSNADEAQFRATRQPYLLYD
jgi:uncharacterized protein YbbC (DUF1343 family)